MKVIFCSLLIISGSLHADTAPEPVVIDRHSVAPLLPLSPGLSVGITQANREKLMNSPEVLAKEAERNTEILAEHSFPWLLVLGMALSGVALWLLWKMREDVLKQRARKNIKTPYEEAIEAVKELKTANLPQQKQYEEFFTRLPNIIRVYLEKAYGLSAMEKTTEELLEDRQFSTLFSADIQQLLTAVLQQADRVKFAQHIPSVQECVHAVDSTETFLRVSEK